jgi:hypothetical protein
LAEGRERIDKDPVQASENFIKLLRRLLKLLQNSLTFHRLKKLRRFVDGEQIYYTKLLQFYLQSLVMRFLAGGEQHGFSM